MPVETIKQMTGNNTAKPRILLAGCLDSDGWISITKYDDQIKRHLKRYENEFDIRVASPFGKGIRSMPLRAMVRRVVYPLQIRAALRRSMGQTLLHVTDQFYAYLLPEGKPGVVTCHDIADFKYTDLTEGQLRRWEKRVSCMKSVKLIFAVSHSTAKELQNILGISSDTIVVNHEGVEDDFRRLPPGHVKGAVASRLVELSTTNPLALHVGVNLNRKNIALALQAVALVRDAGVPLVLVKVGEELKCEERKDTGFNALLAQLLAERAIVNLGRVDDQTLVEVYNVCNLFLLPSFSEGFGFPILEAQASGCPCILSNISSPPEVGGDAALYHDPTNAREMADCILRLLKDTALRDSLVCKGFENVKKFTWDAHIARLAEGYRLVLSSKR